MPHDRATPAGADRRAPRADARRNVESILIAAEASLASDPEATMADIARAAGVGRVTVYGHFPSRADLVDAVFERVNQRANEVLDAVDTSGDPAMALSRLVKSSWQVVHQFRSVLAAAERELPADRIRTHHDRHLQRLTQLLGRGRRLGAFRDDVPTSWLVTVCFTLMHAAAGEVVAGRLAKSSAERAVVSSVLGACRPLAQ
jgi:TetR/AcrR family transcriptional regulator, mexCD-oprJ operon repressor